MPNPAKARGSRWERAVVAYLRYAGIGTARREIPCGRLDEGDIHGIEPCVGQCKDHARYDLAGAVGAAEEQAWRAGQSYGVAFVKRRGAAVDRGYAVMSLATFAALLTELRAAGRYAVAE